MRLTKTSLLALAILFLSATAFSGSPELNSELKKLAAHKGKYTFAVIGDNRSGDNIYKQVMEVAMRYKPLFVMNTGDAIPTPGNRDQWKNFKELSKKITVPYFIAAGNHDKDDKKSEQVWLEELDLPGNEKYYSFTVGRSLYVVLDTVEVKNDRRIEGEQLEWLSKTLDAKKYQHQFVFLHHPLFMKKGDNHYGESLDRYQEQRDFLHKLFVDKKVTAVFAGHEHTYRKTGDIDGVMYIITGGGGAPKHSGFNHAVVVRVDGQSVEAKVVDKTGTLRDEYFIKGLGAVSN